MQNMRRALVSFRDETVAGDARVGRRCVPTLTNAMMTAQAATAEPLHRDRSAVEYHYESIDGLVSLMMHPLRGVPLFQKYAAASAAASAPCRALDRTH